MSVPRFKVGDKVRIKSVWQPYLNSCIGAIGKVEHSGGGMIVRLESPLPRYLEPESNEMTELGPVILWEKEDFELASPPKRVKLKDLDL